jgi:uncharacterized protein
MTHIRRAGTLVLVCAAVSLALDTSKLKPTGYVNDFAHVIDARSKAAIENYAGSVERATGAQFAVVTVDTLEDEPIEDVANRLYREWGVGKKGKDEGLLILLAIRDRKQRTEVGYGLEPVIPDGFAGGVLRTIRPILRQGNYGEALLAAVQQYGQHIADSKGVTIEGRAPRERTRGPEPQSIPWPLILGGIFLLLVLIGGLGRRGGGGRWGGGGGGSGFLTGLLLGQLMNAGRYRGGGYRGGWDSGGWGGGGFGGGGSGGGGFGGFGGGDAGGGGASSDW